MPDTPPPSTEAGSGSPFLLNVLTKTLEKISQYEHISRTLGLPFLFNSMDRIGVFHAAPEDIGTREGNAGQKLDHGKKEIERSRVVDSSHHKALVQTCNELKIPFVADKIIYLPEDSGLTLPSDVWKILRKKLKDEVPEELLKSADSNGNGHLKIGIGEIFTAKGAAEIFKFIGKKLAQHIPPGVLKNIDMESQGGPGAEIGPILSAVGITRFFNLLREAALETGNYENRPVPVTNHATCVYTRHSSSNLAPPTIVNASATLYLFAPKGLKVPYEEPADKNHIVITNDYLCTKDDPNRPISSYLDKHLPDVVNSFRAKMAVNLKKRFDADNLQPPTISAIVPEAQTVIPPSPDAEARERRRIRGLRVTWMRDEKPPIKLSSFRVRKESANDNEKPDDPALALISSVHTFRASDAVIFPPFDPSDHAAALLAKRKLVEFVVHQETDPLYTYRPAIVMDNGCYTSFIKSVIIGSVNAGMSKDLIRTRGLDGRSPKNSIVKTPGVLHIATAGLDIIRHPNQTQLEDAAAEILRVTLPLYHRPHTYDPRPTKTISGGDLSAKPEWTEAVFISASSDNLSLITAGYDLGNLLAKRRDGLVWGGMDRHAGGAPLNGYKDGKGTFAAGFSTPVIIKSETKFGEMPRGCDYWEINPERPIRILHMVRIADALDALPGGRGSIEEIIGPLALMWALPKEMEGKSMIIYSPDLHAKTPYPGGPFYHQVGNEVLGRDNWSALLKDHDALADKGIQMATDFKELERRSLANRERTLAARAAKARGSALG